MASKLRFISSYGKGERLRVSYIIQSNRFDPSDMGDTFIDDVDLKYIANILNCLSSCSLNGLHITLYFLSKEKLDDYLFYLYSYIVYYKMDLSSCDLVIMCQSSKASRFMPKKPVQDGVNEQTLVTLESLFNSVSYKYHYGSLKNYCINKYNVY